MATSDRRIETPVGSKVGKLFEKLEILGISSLLTQSLNQPNGLAPYEQTINIDVPVGTSAIVPMVNLWLLGHGRLRPDQLDPLDDNQHIEWDATDRPWALGKIQVSVVDIDAPDLARNPPTQSARLKVYMRLIDYNGDDPWFGLAGFTLMFLGRISARSRESELSLPERFRRTRLEAQKMR